MSLQTYLAENGILNEQALSIQYAFILLGCAERYHTFKILESSLPIFNTSKLQASASEQGLQDRII